MPDTNSPKTEAKLRIGIISMGDMGSGLARLLVAHGYHVVTNCTGRSEDTISRARAAGVEILPTDNDLITNCDLILSVVPPNDALHTAKRILSAISSPGNPPRRPNNKPLYLADMNAVSPATVRSIASLFSPLPDSTIRFIDGSILGGPPTPPTTTTSSSSSTSQTPEAKEEAEWTTPLLPTSGPFSLSHLDPTNTLPKILNNKHISDSIGQASALKMCFASLSKGYAAIAVQTVTTAYRLGVLDHLKDSLRQLSPANLERMERAVVGMAPKAYRWVREMEEISKTHAEDGGFLTFAQGETESIFDGAAGIFRFVAEGTVLGEEKVATAGSGSNKRVRGTTSEDVARCMAEGLEEREKKRKKKG
ncbi:putative 6-phosphogluconate dehydrogenase [Rhypophila sp. PSN 637]